MKDIASLYRYAEEKQIEILPFSLPVTGSMSLETEDGACFIGIDHGRRADAADERVHLGHELGHCVTGSFYNRYARQDLRQRHENRADKWAIRRLVPVDELDEAVAFGCTELWELAEHFGVTEDFIKKAICLYTHGNLATELYF